MLSDQFCRRTSQTVADVVADAYSGVSVVQYYGATKNGNNTITVGTGSFNGIVVQNSSGATIELCAVFSGIGTTSVQVGIANTSGILPNIISQGANRESFDNYGIVNAYSYMYHWTVPNNKRWFMGNNSATQNYNFKSLYVIR